MSQMKKAGEASTSDISTQNRHARRAIRQFPPD